MPLVFGVGGTVEALIILALGLGIGVWGLGIMKNQMEKNMQHEMEVGV